MRSVSHRHPIAPAILGAAMILAGWQGALADVVGAAGAVNTQSTGTPPGLPVRTIEIGAQVVHNEKISTAKSGTVQIVFIDKTTLNIGPNSTLVIDDFVYSPAEATGRMTLSLGKGVLRIVGGQATHTGGATINTAVATIGIRGGIATLDYCPASARCAAPGLLVTNHFGQVNISVASGASQTISRPGFSVAINANGEMSDSPFRASQATVNDTNKKLTSKGQQKGGSSVTPTDALAQQQGVGQYNAALNPGLNLPRQAQTVWWGTKQNPALVASAIPAGIRASVQTSIAQSAALAAPRSNKDLTFVPPPANVAPPPDVAVVQPVPTPTPSTPPAPAPTPAAPTPAPPTETPPPPAPVSVPEPVPVPPSTPPAGNNAGPTPPPSGGGGGGSTVTILPSTAYALTTTIDHAGLGQNQVPYLLGSVAGTGTWTVSKVLGFRAGGSVPDRFTNTASNVLQAGLSITGTGPSQTSGLVVMSGRVANDKAYGFTLSGGVEATSNLAPGTAIASATTSLSSPANTANPSAGSVPVDSQFRPSGAFAVNQKSFVSDNARDIHLYGSTRTNDGSAATYQFNQTLQPTIPPADLGADHPDQHLQGYVGGVAQTTRVTPLGTSAMIITNATGTPGDVSITLPGQSSSMGATFKVVNSAAPVPSGTLGTTFNFGKLQAGADVSRGTYVDTRNFAALSEQTVDVAGNGYSVSETSSGTGIVGPPNTRDLHLLMVTSDTVLGTSATTHTSSLFPGVNFCACDFTRWGFWSFRTGQTDPNANIGFSGHLLTWVAGLRAGASDIPTTGTATYNGHIIASINNNGAQYSAASNFVNAVNFGTRAGLISIPNLDGAAFAGQVSLQGANPSQFGGIAAGTLGRSMTLNGAFFNSATSPVGEMGGTASITGSNYLGGGIFAAHAR